MSKPRLPENNGRNTGETQAASREQGLVELDLPGFTDWASDQWGIPFQAGQARCLIYGSPERAMSRGVARDIGGRLFLVEKFSKGVFGLKVRIAEILSGLSQKGLTQVAVPEPTTKGGFLAAYEGAVFQVTPFVAGTDLPRPGWLSSRKRGEAMGDFLIKMNKCARGLAVSTPSFSIKAYIYRLFEEMALHNPEQYRLFLPVLEFLEQGFMAVHDGLPVAFCHGDFHPVNVIWDNDRIRAVIDWEFTGIKPRCYDAANLLGCAGIEHPEGLVMPMAASFLARAGRGLDALSLQWLPEYVLALRFAWLSEWLRKSDQEMLETEFRFMEILMAHRQDLGEIWTEAASV